jgi:hypothetical protein
VPEVKRLLEQPPMAGCGEEMLAQGKGGVDRLEHTENVERALEIESDDSRGERSASDRRNTIRKWPALDNGYLREPIPHI